MIINSDINILGSLPDWNLINVFLKENINSLRLNGGVHSYTALKTDKSVRRFENAISDTLIRFQNSDFEILAHNMIKTEQISKDTLMMLFWNASNNNELLAYLNQNVFFPAFYSGRVTIKNDEIISCIKELKETEQALNKWSEVTIKTIASKYLTLLKKFGLMEGTLNKSILHPYLSDKEFVLFIYWLVATEVKPNLLPSPWLQYNFMDKQVFIDRLLQKKYSKYFNVIYTGDRLSIEPTITYKDIYHAVAKS